MQQKTEHQFQAQQDYISLLSQELRVPLYGLVGLTTLIEEEYPQIKNDKKLKFSRTISRLLHNLLLSSWTGS